STSNARPPAPSTPSSERPGTAATATRAREGCRWRELPCSKNTFTRGRQIKVELRVDRQALADAVAWAARTLPTRPALPVLAGMLIEATEEGGLTLAGFDYEVSARAHESAAVAEPGRVLVPGRLLADIVRNLPPQPVDILTKGSADVVRPGPAEFGLQTLPVEDYPTLPEPPAHAGTVPSDLFATAVAQVTPAAGRDDTLPMLTGVRIDIEGDTMWLACTDRYRI